MGVASSKNVASAVANVLNYVQNSTTASADGVNYLKNNTTFKDCTVILSGDLNVENYATISQTSTQILTATQDTSIQNDIQQKMLQEAVSKVGSLGIGYADASNTASMLCNVTNNIINTMNASIQNFSFSSNTFTCDSSYIKAKNINISQASSTNFVSDQTLNNSQTTDIINTVSQSIEQKASATVQGLAAFLIALAVLIGVIAWSFSKVVVAAEGGGVTKAIMISIIVVVIIIVVIWMYLAKCPPFFAEYIIVSPYNPTFGGCENTEVVKVQERTVTLKSTPPLKYNFPIMTGCVPSDRGYLVNMVISKLGGSGGSSMNQSNCGYNYMTYSKIKSATDENKWNVDDNTKLYETIFAGYPGEAADYRLPNLLYLPKCGDKYPLLPQWFIQACNPVCVSFSSTSGCSNAALQLSSQIRTLHKELKLVAASNDSSPTCDIQNGKPGGDFTNVVECCKKQTSFSLADWVASDDSSDPMYTSKDKLDSNSQRVICPFNFEAWSNYLFKESDPELLSKKQLYARFWLSKALGIDCNYYLIQDEPVAYVDDDGNIKVAVAKDNLERCYKFNHFSTPSSYADAITSGGEVTGQFGYCNNNTYKFRKFMKTAGSWILAIIIILICLMIGFMGTKYLPFRSKTKVVKTKEVVEKKKKPT